MDRFTTSIIIAILILLPLVISAKIIRNFLLSLIVHTYWISAMPNKGYASLTGKIRGSEQTSPVSKQECAYWQLEVKEYRSTGRGGHWRTVLKNTSGSIVLDDMTGRVTILDKNPDVLLGYDSRINVDEKTKNTLRSLGLKTEGFLGFPKRFQVYERCITSSEDVLLLGKINPKENQNALAGSTVTPLVISNMSKPELLKSIFGQVAVRILLPYFIMLVVLILFLPGVM